MRIGSQPEDLTVLVQRGYPLRVTFRRKDGLLWDAPVTLHVAGLAPVDAVASGSEATINVPASVTEDIAQGAAAHLSYGDQLWAVGRVEVE